MVATSVWARKEISTVFAGQAVGIEEVHDDIGLVSAWIMIWNTSIWRLGCLNHSTIRSARKCYPCCRYEVLPMSPGRTLVEVVGAKGFEPSTSWSRTRVVKNT